MSIRSRELHGGRIAFVLLFTFTLAAWLPAHAQLLWSVGLDDNGWPSLGGGGPNASFVQENGAVNPLPGSPDSVVAPQGADNDYYFAGIYDTVIPSNGEYEPIGVVSFDEEAAERAFAGGDLELRYHFNLPETLQPDDLLSVTFDAFNLDTSGADPRFGIEVYFNGVLVQPEILIRSAQIDKDYTTPQFTLESVNAVVGPGADNIVTLRGISYNSDGGGNWMGIDYVQLDEPEEAIPAPVFPWAVGLEDDEWPAGDGGGPNASFVQENGTTNPLPGVPNSPETDQQADNDYYFAGLYTNVIAGNGEYEPVGLVSANEEAAERAFAGQDTELRYHFNLPNELRPDAPIAVSFDALNLDTSGTDPRYGVEVYVNGVLVMPEVIIRPADLDQTITTPTFTPAQVNAEVGSGFDNIVTLRGISYSASGGGNWMGIDYVQLHPVAQPIPPPVIPWAVGLDDNGWPSGNGGGPNASFVQESGTANPLPGNPNSPETNMEADDDYYFAGVYTTVIPGNGTYEPVGEVPVNEEAAERAFAGDDNELRYHFNLPANLTTNDMLSVSFDPLSLQEDAFDPHYGIEIYFNNVLVQTQLVIYPEHLGQTFHTPPFTLGQVNARVGPGFDNIVTLRGINYNNEDGGGWMGIDYVQLNLVLPAPFPWSVGRDDNGWPIGNGGGEEASFVQEAGVNPLPGSPNSPEVNQQADDDYYFAGEYTMTIPSVVEQWGEYEPVGIVVVNEEAAERAFAGSDNDLRYHFNLPETLQPSDLLMVTFDANNLDESGEDPHYGIEIYFNGVLIQEEIIIRPENLDVDYTTAPFTLESVNAQTGPGYDNIVHLRGINHSAEGGGQWMGIDYVQLNPMPAPIFPLNVGQPGDGWPVGDGGGPNATFVQENGIVNELPGSPGNPEINQQADNDYYWAGVYTNLIAGNGDYTPVGIVPRNEEAAERALTPGDNELRYHFNLPNSLALTNLVRVTFTPFNLDESGGAPQYGVEIYFNGVLVQPEVIITTNLLGVAHTTEPFTLQSVNAELGPGPDNILTLRGVDYSLEGGGNWLGIDHMGIIGAEDEGEQPTFVSATVSGGNITLNWTGGGTLESAPAIVGPWTPVTPAPTPPYSEAVVATENRFYRLRR